LSGNIKRNKMNVTYNITSFSPRFFYILFFFSILFFGNAGICKYNEGFALEKAKDYLNKGMYLEAVGMYREVADSSADEDVKARALLYIGRTYSLYLDQYDAALDQFNYILKHYPASLTASDALFSTGTILFEKEEFKGAHKMFAEYISKYPGGIRRQSAEVWADIAKSSISDKKADVKESKEALVEDTMIRVLIGKDKNYADVGADSNIIVYDAFSDKMLFSGNGPVNFSKNVKGIAINRKQSVASSFRIEADSRIIRLDNRHYRGHFTLLAGKKGLSIINHVQINKYLYGVVPREMPHSWAKQALMAQAIAARTYVLYIKGKSYSKPYDVQSTTSSQVYGGYDAEKAASNNAVDLTSGQVMTHKGKLIVAYFHSNSGGHTESPGNVWSADVPYLIGVPDKFCKDNKKGDWEYFLTYDKIRSRLNRYGLSLDNVQGIKVKGRSKSGRALKINVVSQQGISMLTGNNFRIKTDATKLKSTLFQLEKSSEGILFRGKGYGHGVGMSQWGAQKMALEGYNFEDILKHYYHNIKIVSIR